MSVSNDDVMERIQNDAAERLRSMDWFSSVCVLEYREGDILSEAQRALMVQNPDEDAAHKMGACIVIHMPTLKEPRAGGAANVRTPLGDLILEVDAYEYAGLNMSADGTGKSAEKLAWRILRALHHYYPSGYSGQWFAENNRVQPLGNRNNVRGYKVTFRIPVIVHGDPKAANPSKHSQHIGGGEHQITLAHGLDTAEIYYTLDESLPRPGFGALYTEPLILPEPFILRAAAYVADYEPSNVVMEYEDVVERAFAAEQLAAAQVSYYQSADYPTPTARRDGHTFWVFIGHEGEFPENGHTPANSHFPPSDVVDENPVLKLVICHVTPDGDVSYHVVKTGVILDPTHCAPSLAIDTAGILHLTGDMHLSVLQPQDPDDATSTDWIYYRSRSPLNATAWDAIGGSTVNGGLPHALISYARLRSDLAGNLYCTYRARVGSFNEEPSCGCLARWIVEDQVWTPIGGSDVVPAPAPAGDFWAGNVLPTLFMTRAGSTVGTQSKVNYYGHYKNALYITRDGRLHVATVMFGNEDLGAVSTTVGAMAVLYAYSDDLGDTWYRADGSAIASLPMTVDPNLGAGTDGLMTVANSGVVAWANNENSNGLQPYISFTFAGAPVLQYFIGAATTRSVWNGSEWEEYAGASGYPYGTRMLRQNGLNIEITTDGAEWTALTTLANANNTVVAWQDVMNGRGLNWVSVHIYDLGTGPLVDQRFPGTLNTLLEVEQ